VIGAAVLLVLEFEGDEEVVGGRLDLEDQAAVAAYRAEEVEGVDQGVVLDGYAADAFQLIDTAAGAEFGRGQYAVCLLVTGPADHPARRAESRFDRNNPGGFRAIVTRPHDHQMFAR